MSITAYVGRKWQGAGFYSNTRSAHSAPTRGSGGAWPPMKTLDFKPSEIVFDAFFEYIIARITRTMQTAHLALEASRLYRAKIKRDVDY